MFRMWIFVAGLAGATGVAIGAYASHGLGFIPAETRELARATLLTAVQYQLLHALALLGVGLWSRSIVGGSTLLNVAAGLFTIGIVLFCGLIYARYLGDFDSLRRFVPWGGSSFILAWLTVSVAAIRTTKQV